MGTPKTIEAEKRASGSLDRLVRRFHVHYSLRGHDQRMIIDGESLDVAITVKEALDDGATHIKLWEIPCMCDGSGGVDSGGVTPSGQPITVPCPACSPNDRI